MADQPRPEFLRELATRVADDRRKAEGAVLWEIIQEEVANELDRRFHATVSGESLNGIRVTLQAEEGAINDAAKTVSYRMGLIVNGRNLEVAATIPMGVALLEGRHAVMDALKASLAERLAELLLEGFKFPGRM